jgi:MFS family permease
VTSSAERSAPGPEGREPIFTSNFTLACFGSLASFLSFYLLLATLSVYVVHVGGDESTVGMVMGTLSTTAILLRLPLGRASDRRGKLPLLLTGAALLSVCGVLYTFTRSIPTIVGVRVLNGIGWALFGTVISALVADIAPKRRRGEAMGYYGIFANLAMAVGPATGVFLMRSFSFTVVFGASAVMAAVAFLTTLPIREGAPVVPAAPQTEGEPPMIERSSIFPSSILALLAMSYSAIVTFLPIYAPKHGLANPGGFFTAYAITLVLSRSFTGRLSDKHGRASVIIPGLVFAAAALLLLSVAGSILSFICVAVLFGLGFASVQPALMAMVIDRAPPGRRGAAMGIFATAMDAGIGLGAFIWGFVAKSAGFRSMFLSASCAALLGLLIFLKLNRAAAAPQPAEPPRG